MNPANTPDAPSAKNNLMRVAVLGGGSFGTAIAHLSAKNNTDTTLWIRDEVLAQEMAETHRNTKYLPDFPLDPRLNVTSDLAEAVKDKDIIFVAIPSHSFRRVIQQIAPMITGQVVVSLTKGIEAETFALMSDIFQSELPNVAFGVMSGPNLAKELLAGMPAGTVIASTSEPLRRAVHTALASQSFRVFGNTDVHGVELAGTLKNIYAVAMGIAVAYKMGENAKSLLLTRALAEMSRFAVTVGANPMTFLGLAGVGDLFATCNSLLSRNVQIGLALGSGKSLEQAIHDLGSTAEGVNTIQQIKFQSDAMNVYMPITQALYKVIFEGQSPLETMKSMMNTGPRSDVEFVLPQETEAVDELIEIDLF